MNLGITVGSVLSCVTPNMKGAVIQLYFFFLFQPKASVKPRKLLHSKVRDREKECERKATGS